MDFVIIFICEMRRWFLRVGLDTQMAKNLSRCQGSPERCHAMSSNIRLIVCRHYLRLEKLSGNSVNSRESVALDRIDSAIGYLRVLRTKSLMFLSAGTSQFSLLLTLFNYTESARWVLIKNGDTIVPFLPTEIFLLTLDRTTSSRAGQNKC